MNSINSWLTIPPDSDFSLHNLPFGIFSKGTGIPSVGIAIGDWIIDMAAAEQLGVLASCDIAAPVFKESTLNALMALGRTTAQQLRNTLQEQLTQTNSALHQVVDRVLVRQADARMHLPAAIGDYTDFYSSLEHATNVGKLFRPDNPLLPNWKHLPVAYHGRASSIVVSGTSVRRPSGQITTSGANKPIFSPSQALDFELELGFLVGKNSELGTPIRVDEAEDYLFGCVLFNDWSARDIQRWEYQPLGPFLSKNFASSVSPWVVTMDALKAFRVAGPKQSPEPLPYLNTAGALNFDLDLEVTIKPPVKPGSTETIETIVSCTNARHLYWNISQQLVHHTVSGCNLRVGDLLATGAISGPDGSAKPHTAGSPTGCLLELTEGGKKPIMLSNGDERTYLLDGDEVIMRGYAKREGIRVGFGEVRGKVLPPQEFIK